MNQERPCEQCRFYSDHGQPWCGAYDMPCEVATTRPLLCGPTAEDFVRRPMIRHAESWAVILVMLAAVVGMIVFGIHGDPGGVP